MIKPRWQRELDVFSNIKTTFVFENNIYDTYAWGDNEETSFIPLDDYLYRYIRNEGYEDVIFYDPINGFYNRFDTEKDIKQILRNCGCTDSYHNCSNDYLGQTLCPDKVPIASDAIKEMILNNHPVAIVMSFASRYCASPDSLPEDERLVFMDLLYASLNSRETYIEGTGLRRNLLCLIVDKINDVPPWFYINNPNQVTISIPLPDKETRENYITYRECEFPGFVEATDEEKATFKSEILWLTEGMSCFEINGLKNLCKKENIHIADIKDAVTLYKFGVKENPWSVIPREVLLNAENIIKESVKGQDSAVRRVVDVVKRAAIGLSGLQHSSSGSKPKGIMFFAGPTGVGKTEMAKALAKMLFGTDEAVIRFDMSEYQQGHSDQKLLGAPPGYVGYEAGGQLTNAVRKKPFSILLFDEIEKAHPTILDKFLQILEDGRMTDGQGNVTYFSETIIIFTSNLGIYKMDQNKNYLLDPDGNKIPNVTPSDSYEVLRDNILNAVSNYMRPEILNRIGNNIIVFKYVDEGVSKKILEEKLLPNIISAIKEKIGIQVDISSAAYIELMEAVSKNLANGGRGIGNVLETYILNPVARQIVDNDLKEGDSIKINKFSLDEDIVYIESE